MENGYAGRVCFVETVNFYPSTGRGPAAPRPPRPARESWRRKVMPKRSLKIQISPLNGELALAYIRRGIRPAR